MFSNGKFLFVVHVMRSENYIPPFSKNIFSKLQLFANQHLFASGYYLANKLTSFRVSLLNSFIDYRSTSLIFQVH